MGQPVVDVVIVNESSNGLADFAGDKVLEGFLPALQQQVSGDFAPVWGTDARLRFAPRGAKPDASAWWLVVLDNSDQAGALGYHDLTSAGLPIGKVFAASDQHYGESLSVTMSHELLEMLGDPGINMTASSEDQHGNVRFFAYEACDACEADEYAYEIDGVLVSDFVYPSWFGGAESSQFDHQKKIAKPFEILDGGYIGVWTVGTGWTQLTGTKAHGAAARSRASVGSRRERRQAGPARWARSI